MLTADLARVLALSRSEKLEFLARLCPSDVAAIDMILNDCLTYRWPKTPAEWFAVDARLSAKH